MTEPFPMVEVSLQEFIETKYPPVADRVGGDPSYVAGESPYVWISMIPGSGSTDEIEGTWAIDVDVFGTTYGQAMTISLALEAHLLAGRRFKASNGLIIDSIVQNTAPGERPWDADDIHLVGGTYVVTARRSG